VDTIKLYLRKIGCEINGQAEDNIQGMGCNVTGVQTLGFFTRGLFNPYEF
jgi:hypothetical protein